MTDIEELIEHYLSKSMTAKEVRAFEDRLAHDQALKQEFENTLTARKLITEAGRLNLKQQLKDFDSNIEIEDRSIIKSLWLKRTLQIAAALVVGLGIYYFSLNKSMSSDEVYSTYFELYTAPSAERNSTVENANWNQAIDYYKQYDFTKAITYFDLVKAEVPAYQIDFFKGICYMSLKEPNLDEALKQFNLVITTDNDYNQQARWYKAIVFLKQKNLVSARQILEEIVDNKSYNYLEAKKILDLNVTIK